MFLESNKIQDEQYRAQSARLERRLLEMGPSRSRDGLL